MTRSGRVAVVGGGLAGLTAAYELADAGAEVVVFESTNQIGGKLQSGELAGIAIDLGAESILARRPEAIALMDRIGLPYEPVRTSQAAVWSHGQLRPLPRTVMGIPADLDELVASGIVADRPESNEISPSDDDISVAAFVESGLGRDIVDRLVDPLLGGVYAGHADRLSLAATAPQIRSLAPNLVAGAADALAAGSGSPGPVFVAPTGGVGRLPLALAEAGDFEICLNTTVRALERIDGGWRLTTGPTSNISEWDFEAVVVATPAPAASRLLATVAPDAAFALAGIDYASIAIVTFVLDGAEFDGSGFLVPSIEAMAVKAATCSTNKWQWSRDAAAGRTVVRTSLGRAGETQLLQRDDTEVIADALAALRTMVPNLGEVSEAHVQRWGGALPQYEVGHLDLVARVEQTISAVSGLQVCGAAYRGVGIPAVIASAQSAASQLLHTGTE